MRIQLIFIIVFTAMLQVSASSFAQKININQTNISLEKALKLIRQQSGYDVLYDSNVIKKPTGVMLNVKNGTVADALKQCLTGTGFTYQIEENTILIKEKSYVKELIELINHEFNTDVIRGTVWANKNNEVLAGATVMVKRTKKAVYTNAYGIFTIKDVLPTDTLVFSYIGYVSLNIAVGKEKEFLIKLEETTNALDAIVVQAYGKTTQRLTTGNIVRVTAADISKQLVSDPLIALQGAVPGLEIRRSDGNERSVAKVEIRGRSSINSNFSSAPLYIIDGVPLMVLGNRFTNSGANNQSYVSPGMDQGNLSASSGINPLYNINPADIESIEILKDADATAIYGSRGGNGVILITTKKGAAGKTKLSINGNQGIKRTIKRWETLNTAQYLDMRRESFANDNVIPTPTNAPELLKYDQTKYTDWQDYIYGNPGTWTDVQASISGGDVNTNFRISTGINRVKDIAVISGINQKLSVSSSILHKSPDQRFSIDFSGSYGSSESNTRSIGFVSLLPPNGPDVYNEKGTLNFNDWQTDMSEFAMLERDNKGTFNSLASSLNMGYILFKDLSLNVLMGYSSNISEQRHITPLATINLASNPSSQSYISNSNTTAKNLIIEPQAEYNTFLGKGKVNALIGATLQHTSTTTNSLLARGFASDEQLKSINAATSFVNSEKVLYHKYLGVFARLNYNFENKYILNLNARRDGSSRFGPANRFGNFGSVGLAWIASEEEWLKKSLPKFISLVKFRGSYGVLGSDPIGDYQYLTQWGGQADGVKMWPYEGVNPVVPQIQPNDDFHWQKNIKSELAMAVSFFKDKINAELALYREYCNNQLLSFPIAGYTGFNTVVLNSPAEVLNKGLEFTLNASIISTKNFSWNGNFNIGKNVNKLVGYPKFEESPYYAYYKIGQSLNNTYVFHSTGVDPQTGEYTFADINGDGKVQEVYNVPTGTAGDDRYVAINTSPDFSGGMGHTFSYKNFSLSGFFSYARQTGRELISPYDNKNMSVYQYENTWRKPGDQAIYSKFSSINKQTNGFYSTSDAMYVDASFIRLKSIQFSYRLPVEKLRAFGLNSFALNITGDNIFVLTKYRGMDPEVQQFGGMPLTRTITMGLNCSF